MEGGSRLECRELDGFRLRQELGDSRLMDDEVGNFQLGEGAGQFQAADYDEATGD